MGIIYTTPYFTNPGSETIIEMLEDYYEVKLDLTWVADANYKEKLGVTLMSNDMPMVITVPSVDATIIQAAKAGAFWDMNDFIFDSAKYPNLSQANENVNKLLTVDGQLIGLYRSRPIGRNGWGYRKDWADKLGLTTPQTLQEFYDMAYAFAHEDPDGNGQKDTFGLSMCKDVWAVEQIITWHGAGNGWIEQDGQLVPSFYTEEYIEAMDYLRKMYENEVIVPDWAVRDSNTKNDAMQSGEAGMYISTLDDVRRAWDFLVNNNIPSVTGGETAEVELVGTLKKDADSEKSVIATSGMNGFMVVTKGAETEEDVANALRMLDRHGDPDNRLFQSYGIEGDPEGWHWVKDETDGKEYVELIDQALKPEQRKQNGANQLGPLIPALPTDPRIKLQPRVVIEEAIKADNDNWATFNPAGGYLINADTYAKNGAALDQIIMDARTQYISMQIDKDGLLAAFETWKSRGGTTLVEEVNAMYQADK
jgi:putative aldouronate transport system substrate-binding protein